MCSCLAEYSIRGSNTHPRKLCYNMQIHPLLLITANREQIIVGSSMAQKASYLWAAPENTINIITNIIIQYTHAIIRIHFNILAKVLNFFVSPLTANCMFLSNRFFFSFLNISDSLPTRRRALIKQTIPPIQVVQ